MHPQECASLSPLQAGAFFLKPLHLNDLSALSSALQDTAPDDGAFFWGLGDRRISGMDWMDWRLRQMQQHGACVVALRNGLGQIVGEVAVLPCGRSEAQASFWIRRSCCGQHWARSALAPVCAWAFSAWRLSAIVFLIDPRNTASLRVVAHLGAMRSTSEGALHDAENAGEPGLLAYRLTPEVLGAHASPYAQSEGVLHSLLALSLQ